MLKKQIAFSILLIGVVVIGFIAQYNIYSKSIDFTFGADPSPDNNPNLSYDGKDQFLQTSTGKWKLIWSDEFQGKTLDETKWNRTMREENYNGELHYYHPNNVTLKDGFANLTAKKQKMGIRKYTSGQITTQDLFSFQYGKVEVRGKFPTGKGMFPAIWMLPEFNHLPEIDILEAIGSEPNNIYYVHHWTESGKKQKANGSTTIKDPKQFHTYGIEWEANELRYYVDRKLVFRSNKGIPQEKMYLLINLAVGGNWAGAPNPNHPFPSTFLIDYVRVYSKEG